MPTKATKYPSDFPFSNAVTRVAEKEDRHAGIMQDNLVVVE